MESSVMIYALGGAAIGYTVWLLVLAMVRSRLRTDQSREHEEIIASARHQGDLRKQQTRERVEDEIQSMREELEEEVASRAEDHKVAAEDLDMRHSSMQREESRLSKAEKDLETRKTRVQFRTETYNDRKARVEACRVQVAEKLATVSGTEVEQLRTTMTRNIIDRRQLEAQKVLNLLDEELGGSSKRLANRMLARVSARYAPNFFWPKSINFVELTDPRLVDGLKQDDATLVSDMKEVSGIEIELLADSDTQQPILRLAGGAGINREAARLAFLDLFKKGRSAWARPHETYEEHRDVLETQAIKLGRKAIQQLQLKNVHPEIQKLVGYLNWRTSYRQNQWYHTVEVAQLAGILGHELGVDPDKAKRSGLMHDIGKALDYRIEGSHAVISGDYADRFGESREICDTVMSHHNDLVLETALSFVLKAADTLSGARPGARVNLEEGYQTRLSGIDAAIRSFPGVANVAIMNGAREVHVEVNHKKVKDKDLERLTSEMAAKVASEVAFPGEIKILVSRRFEATAVA